MYLNYEVERYHSKIQVTALGSNLNLGMVSFYFVIRSNSLHQLSCWIVHLLKDQVKIFGESCAEGGNSKNSIRERRIRHTDLSPLHRMNTTLCVYLIDIERVPAISCGSVTFIIIKGKEHKLIRGRIMINSPIVSSTFQWVFTHFGERITLLIFFRCPEWQRKKINKVIRSPS